MLRSSLIVLALSLITLCVAPRESHANELGVQLHGGYGWSDFGDNSAVLGGRFFALFDVAALLALGPALDVRAQLQGEDSELVLSAKVRIEPLPWLSIDVLGGFGLLLLPNSGYDTSDNTFLPAGGGGVDLLFSPFPLPFSLKLGPTFYVLQSVARDDQQLLDAGLCVEIAY